MLWRRSCGSNDDRVRHPPLGVADAAAAAAAAADVMVTVCARLERLCPIAWAHVTRRGTCASAAVETGGSRWAAGSRWCGNGRQQRAAGSRWCGDGQWQDGQWQLQQRGAAAAAPGAATGAGNGRRKPRRARDRSRARRCTHGVRATYYLRIFTTVPAPTVRPPSRIAKRRPSSMAIGWIRLTVISVVSPGMTISVPSGSVMIPVTSVVRK